MGEARGRVIHPSAADRFPAHPDGDPASPRRREKPQEDDEKERFAIHGVTVDCEGVSAVSPKRGESPNHGESPDAKRLRLHPDGSFLVAIHQKGTQPMTLEDLLARLLPILPNLLLDEEPDGEVLIYTGFRQTQDGRLEGVGG